MKNHFTWKTPCLLAGILALSACSGGGGGDDTPAPAPAPQPAPTPLSYQDVSYFVNDNGSYGYQDKDKNTVINATFDKAYPFASNNIARVVTEGKWSYIDINGAKIAAIPEFDWLYDFDANGNAKVLKGDKYGLINASGTTVLNAEYDAIKAPVDDAYIATKGGTHIIFDKTGKERGKQDAREIKDFSPVSKMADFAVPDPAHPDTSSYDKHGCIGTDGAVKFPAQYHSIDCNVPAEEYRHAQSDSTYGYLNKHGEYATKEWKVEKVRGTYYPEYKRYISASTTPNRGYGCTLYQEDGKQLFNSYVGDRGFCTLIKLKDSAIFVTEMTNGLDSNIHQKNIIDINGKAVLTTSLESPEHNADIYNEKSDKAISAASPLTLTKLADGFKKEYTDYEYISSNRSHILFRKGAEYGIMDYEGNTVVPLSSKEIRHMYEGRTNSDLFAVFDNATKFTFYTLKNGQWQQTNSKQYDEYDWHQAVNSLRDSDLAEVKLNSKYGIVDKDGKELIAPKFDSIGSFTDSYAKTTIGTKHGFIDINGKEVVKAEYDSVRHLRFADMPTSNAVKKGDYFVVKNSGKEGLVDKNHNVILPLEYQNIDAMDVNTKWVSAKNVQNKMGMVDLNNTVKIPFNYALLWPDTPIDGAGLITAGQDNQPTSDYKFTLINSAQTTVIKDINGKDILNITGDPLSDATPLLQVSHDKNFAAKKYFSITSTGKCVKDCQNNQ